MPGPAVPTERVALSGLYWLPPGNPSSSSGGSSCAWRELSASLCALGAPCWGPRSPAQASARPGGLTHRLRSRCPSPGAADRPPGLQRHPGERGPGDRGPAGSAAALPQEQAVTAPRRGWGAHGVRERRVLPSAGGLLLPRKVPGGAAGSLWEHSIKNRRQLSSLLGLGSGVWRTAPLPLTAPLFRGAHCANPHLGRPRGWKTGCAGPQSSHLQNTHPALPPGEPAATGSRGLRGAGEDRAWRTAWTAWHAGQCSHRKSGRASPLLPLPLTRTARDLQAPRPLRVRGLASPDSRPLGVSVCTELLRAVAGLKLHRRPASDLPWAGVCWAVPAEPPFPGPHWAWAPPGGRWAGGRPSPEPPGTGYEGGRALPHHVIHPGARGRAWVRPEANQTPLLGPPGERALVGHTC